MCKINRRVDYKKQNIPPCFFVYLSYLQCVAWQVNSEEFNFTLKIREWRLEKLVYLIRLQFQLKTWFLIV